MSSATVLLNKLPDDIVKKLPRNPAVPAVLIDRLARHVDFPGVGKLPLMDALARPLQRADEVAATVVLVDAKSDQAREFYQRYGFVDVADTSNRMFLPMQTVEKLPKSSS